MQYDGYYGWVKSQYQGLGASSGTQLTAGSVMQMWRRDPYGYVVKEGLPMADPVDPVNNPVAPSEYVRQAQDAWGVTTQA